jgi:hypothetical protein
MRPPPSPAPSHSSSSSLVQSVHRINGIFPLSSPYECRMKWLDLLGNSLGFNPGPISDLASSSQLALVIPPNSPVDSAHEPSLVHSPPVQDLSEVLYTIHGHQQEKPHSCLDCASYTKIQEGLAILQCLVFELRKDLDELHFHLEVLEWKGIKFLKILLALHGTCNPSDVEPNAPRNKKPI